MQKHCALSLVNKQHRHRLLDFIFKGRFMTIALRTASNVALAHKLVYSLVSIK